MWWPTATLGCTCLSQMWPLQMFHSICKGSAGKHISSALLPSSDWLWTALENHRKMSNCRDFWCKERWCSLRGRCPRWNDGQAHPLLPPPFSMHVWWAPSVTEKSKLQTESVKKSCQKLFAGFLLAPGRRREARSDSNKLKVARWRYLDWASREWELPSGTEQQEKSTRGSTGQSYREMLGPENTTPVFQLKRER